MKVPILRVPFSESDKEEICRGIAAVLDSGYLTMGKQTEEFEELFRELTGSRFAIAVSNGTAALELILRGLGVHGRNVIVPTNTFLATALAVLHSGNRVVFADSDPKTLCLSLADVRERVDEETAAVIAVHIGGIISPEIGALRDFCRDAGIHLIEDCAHAHGCAIDGDVAGTLGVAGAFSFFPTKVLTSGEGGMITTDDPELADAVKMLRNHGKDPGAGNRISQAGGNYRISEITALLGAHQTRNAAALFADRRRAAACYDEALPAIDRVEAVALPPGVESTYYKYIVYLDDDVDRAQLKKIMKEDHGVALTGEVYADLCHTEPLWADYTLCGVKRESAAATCARWPACGCGQVGDDVFPGAERISRHHACLPVYAGLTDAELEHVVAALGAALAKA